MINKTFKTILSVAAIFSCSQAFADGLIFDPESYPVSKAEAVKTTNVQTSPYVTAPTVNTKTVTDVQNQVTRENNNMQDALFKLDSAQTDIRNQLLDERAKYTDLDNKYKAIKEQRKIQKKLVKDSEKKINQLEKNKSQIRKLMQVQQ